MFLFDLENQENLEGHGIDLEICYNIHVIEFF